MNQTSAAKQETAAGLEAAKQDKLTQIAKGPSERQPLDATAVRTQLVALRKRLGAGERVRTVWERGALYAEVLKDIASGKVKDIPGLCREALACEALEVSKDDLPHR